MIVIAGATLGAVHGRRGVGRVDAMAPKLGRFIFQFRPVAGHRRHARQLGDGRFLAVLGQRLLRSICPQCRTTYQPTETLLEQLGLSRRDIGAKNFFYGKGCDVCNQTGYKGRKGIYELLKLTDPLRELINERAPTVTLKEKAIELGMVTLRQDGLRSIFAGDTTIEEVLKYT